MSRHLRLDDDARDQAALFALGSLPAADAARMEAHLAECPECRAEVDALAPVVGDLALATPGIEPPPGLRERVLARAREESAPAAQPWKEWASTEGAGGFTLALAAQGSWDPTAFRGVETRRLFVDRPGDRITMLVRMAPGSSYPSHRHGGPEECYVLQGVLLSGDLRMKAGDYKHAAEGSVDPVQSTEEGCLLLIASSARDELLAGGVR